MLDPAATEERVACLVVGVTLRGGAREGDDARLVAMSATPGAAAPPGAAGARDADVLACVDAASRAADTLFAVVRGVLHDKCEQEAAQGLLSAM